MKNLKIQIIAFVLITMAITGKSVSAFSVTVTERVASAVQLYNEGKQDIAIEDIREVVKNSPDSQRWEVLLAGILIEDAPRKYGFPTPIMAYREPCNLVDRIKSKGVPSETIKLSTDSNMLYAICLSLLGHNKAAIEQFKNIFSGQDVINAGAYRYGLSVYAIDLISAGRSSEAEELLKNYLEKNGVHQVPLNT